MQQGLLLRGLMRDSRHWGAFRQQLQLATPNIQWHSVDFPGNGQHYQQTSPSSIRECRIWLQQHLAAQNMTGPFYVIALSMGGMVVLDWIQSGEPGLLGATLINTSAKPLCHFYQRLSPWHYPSILRLLINNDCEMREQFIWRATTALTHQNIVTKWMEWAKACPVNRCNVIRQLYAAARFRLNIQQKPNIPLQLINSTHDRLVSAECSQRLAQLWDLPLVTHPLAGHDLPLDDAAWLIQHMGDIYTAVEADTHSA